MTNMELLLNSLAEEAATQLSKERNPEGLSENAGGGMSTLFLIIRKNGGYTEIDSPLYSTVYLVV